MTTILNESAPHAVHFIVFDVCRNNLGGHRGAKGFNHGGASTGPKTKAGKGRRDEGFLRYLERRKAALTIEPWTSVSAQTESDRTSKSPQAGNSAV
jgi:hypothetical protein